MQGTPPRDRIFFNFMQFLGNVNKIISWCPPPPEGWRPLLGEILDPPLVCSPLFDTYCYLSQTASSSQFVLPNQPSLFFFSLDLPLHNLFGKLLDRKSAKKDTETIQTNKPRETKAENNLKKMFFNRFRKLTETKVTRTDISVRMEK